MALHSQGTLPRPIPLKEKKIKREGKKAAFIFKEKICIPRDAVYFGNILQRTECIPFKLCLVKPAAREENSPFWNIHLIAELPTPGSWWAGALEVIDQVDAGPSILAGLELALIHLVLTVDPLVSRHTLWAQKGV